MKPWLALCLLVSAVVVAAAGCDAGCAAVPPGASFPAHAVMCRILVDRDAVEERRAIAPSGREDSPVAHGEGTGDWLPVAEGSKANTVLATIENALTRQAEGKVEVCVAASESDVTGRDISAYYPGRTHPLDGSPAIFFDLTRDGAIRLASLTAQNLGRRLAIIVDGEVWAVHQIKTQHSSPFILSFPTAEDHDRVAARLHRLDQRVTRRRGRSTPTPCGT
jgi:hypothetical protein